MKQFRIISLFLIVLLSFQFVACASNQKEEIANPSDDEAISSGSAADTPTGDKAVSSGSLPSSETSDEPSTPEEQRSLRERYILHDPDVTESYMSVVVNGLDTALKEMDFMVVGKYVGKNAKEHKLKFEIVETYSDRGDIHVGDVLQTTPEPCDLMLTDVKTGEIEYCYTSAMGKNEFVVGKEYVFPGVYLDDIPYLAYGAYIPADDIGAAKNCEYPLFGSISGQPAPQFQPDENTTAEDFIEYCLTKISEAKS